MLAMIRVLRFLLSLTAICYLSSAAAESFLEPGLERRAEHGFKLSVSDGQLLVKNIVTDSPAFQKGVREKLRLLSINNQPVNNLAQARELLRKIKAGQRTQLQFEGQKLVSYQPAAKALEDMPGSDSYYTQVNTSDGSVLRAIVSTPADNKQPLATIFFVQWVSCGSMEYRARSLHSQILQQLVVLGGYSLIRVERSTSGDSVGPACDQLDYNTELSHYVQAYQKLKSHALVDGSNMVIMGSSLGSTLAPLLAEQLLNQNTKPKAITVNGGGALTYLERMLAFDRAYIERSGKWQPDEFHQQWLTRALFQVEYLLKQRHPDDIAKDSEQMAYARQNVRGLGADEHYGRPFSWHQQAAQHNFMQAWQVLDMPVLVVFNQFDQFETEHGHKMIVEQLNKLRPGSAEYTVLAQTGHSFYRYSDIEKAYLWQGGQAVAHNYTLHLLNWLSRVLSNTNSTK